MKRKGIVIVGATGSIGRQTLDVIRRFPDAFRLVGVAAGTRVEPLLDIAGQDEPGQIVVATEEAEARLLERLEGRGRKIPAVAAGTDALNRLVSGDDVDLVVMAMVGARALRPTLAALEAGKDVALATKEVLVAGGEVVTAMARKSGARLLPVDSEHNAIFQCLQGEAASHVHKLILTASGGPFRQTPGPLLADVKPEQALRHPTWSMGAKVTIDSATLMNKGLEVIEARWLFNVPVDRIEVVVHPQSIVHSAVEFVDGSILAHVGPTDMRIPIQHALFWPDRQTAPTQRLSLADVGKLTFERPDLQRFPSLGLAYDAARIGGTAPAVLNAANEVAVELFLKGAVGFTDIPRLVEQVLEQHVPQAAGLEEVLAADGWARDALRAIGAGAAM